MVNKRRSGKAGKLERSRKAFIGSMPVDIWFLLIFVLTITVFWFIFKWSAEAKMQQIQDKRDITYGNYLAQVYLKSPLTVGGQEMTVAELISLYDYNQSLEKQKDKSYAEIVDDKLMFIFGKRNAMLEALEGITEEFVKASFDEDRCFFFAIYGNAFEFNYKSDSCPGAKGFGLKYLFSYLGDVPESAYTTYIAPVDPRATPLIVFSIYDFERLLSVYAPDPYFDMDAARRAFIAMECSKVPVGAYEKWCRDWYTK